MSEAVLAGLIGGATGAICVIVLCVTAVAFVAWLHRDDPFED